MLPWSQKCPHLKLWAILSIFLWMAAIKILNLKNFVDYLSTFLGLSGCPLTHTHHVNFLWPNFEPWWSDGCSAYGPLHPVIWLPNKTIFFPFFAASQLSNRKSHASNTCNFQFLDNTVSWPFIIYNETSSANSKFTTVSLNRWPKGYCEATGQT